MLQIHTIDAELQELLSNADESSAHFIHQLVIYFRNQRDFEMLLKIASPKRKLETIKFKIKAVHEVYLQMAIDGSRPVETLDELYEVATFIEQPFKEEMERIGTSVGGSVTVEFPPGLKLKNRAEEKAEDDYGNNFGMLFDIVRMLFLCGTGAEMKAVAVAVQKSGCFVHGIKWKNRCKYPTANGFFDLMLQGVFAFEVGSIIVEHACEIQIHFRPAHEYADTHKSHEVYEFFRSFFAGSEDTVVDRMESIATFMEGEDNSISETNSGFIDKLDFDAMSPRQIFEQLVADVWTSTTNDGETPDTERLVALGDLFSQDVEEHALAVALHKKALAFEIEEEADSGNVAEAYDKVAMVLELQGKLDEALDLYQKSMAITIKEWGPETCQTATSYRNIGDIMSAKDHYDDSRHYYKLAMAIYIKLGSDFEDDVAKMEMSIGSDYDDEEKYTLAHECYGKALNLLMKDEDYNERELADLYKNYGELYRKTEEYDKAMENYKKCLAISIRLEGKESSNVGDVYHSIGAAIREGDGDLDEALELVQMGMATAIRVYGPDHGHVGSCHESIAYVLLEQNKYAEAISELKRALVIFTNFHGSDHRLTCAVRDTLQEISE